MKSILLSLVLLTALNADKILQTTLACPSVVTLQKSVTVDMQDVLELEMYAIAHDCVVIGRYSKVEAIGYDPLNSKEIYQKIMYKKTATELYINRSLIQVEQAGKKNTIRF